MCDQSVKDKVYVLTEEDLRKIYQHAAEIGANEAIKTVDSERKKEVGRRADKRLHNTTLLLQNFKMLKSHVENSVFSRDQLEEENPMEILEELMNVRKDRMIVESIQRSAVRTAIIVEHVESMISLYRIYCEQALDSELETRRFNIMWDSYLADQKLRPDEMSEKYGITKSSVYACRRVATQRLSALIFGIDALTMR